MNKNALYKSTTQLSRMKKEKYWLITSDTYLATHQEDEESDSSP